MYREGALRFWNEIKNHRSAVFGYCWKHLSVSSCIRCKEDVERVTASPLNGSVWARRTPLTEEEEAWKPQTLEHTYVFRHFEPDLALNAAWKDSCDTWLCRPEQIKDVVPQISPTDGLMVFHLAAGDRKARTVRGFFGLIQNLEWCQTVHAIWFICNSGSVWSHFLKDWNVSIRAEDEQIIVLKNKTFWFLIWVTKCCREWKKQPHSDE